MGTKKDATHVGVCGGLHEAECCVRNAQTRPSPEYRDRGGPEAFDQAGLPRPFERRLPELELEAVDLVQQHLFLLVVVHFAHLVVVVVVVVGGGVGYRGLLNRDLISEYENWTSDCSTTQHPIRTDTA